MKDKIRRIIAQELQIDPGQMADDATVEALGLDSLTMVEVVIAIERMTGRSIDTGGFVDDIQEDTPLVRVIDALNNAVVHAGAQA